MYINPQRPVLMYHAPVSQYQCHPGGFLQLLRQCRRPYRWCSSLAAPRTSWVGFLCCGWWQEGGGGPEDEQRRKVTGSENATRAKAKKLTGCSGAIMENWQWGFNSGGTRAETTWIHQSGSQVGVLTKSFVRFAHSWQSAWTFEPWINQKKGLMTLK